MKTVVFFRGYNTANIIADARRFGLIGDHDTIVVMCRKDDALAEPGDRIHIGLINGPVVVVCNGGTTGQQIPVVVWAVRRADSPGECQGEVCPGEQSTLVEVTRDANVVLWAGVLASA